MAKIVSTKKLYAMQRMSAALKRASAARPFGPDTDRALRWAAAWGMSAGIRTPHTRLRLRRDTLLGVDPGLHRGA
ncbi:hypothetical protein [Massilia sp. BKSP1R2A-1]|uniref:hypothetical protein n=1 Tax=Massilia sp. BKSP1R2A-1 TaxID=3422595 RepID=UPI003D3297F3